MNVLCRDRNCHCVHSANAKSSRAIRREVQAGVDVAIATKILTLACENRLDGVVLLAGDGDFVDAVKYVKETLNKKVFVVGFKDSLSARLMPYAESPNGVVILDDFVELVAAGGTGVVGNAIASSGSSNGSNGVARPRSPPSDGDFAAGLVPSAPSAAELWAATSRNNSSSRSNSTSNNSNISRQSSNNEALVRQLVNVGVADEAGCRIALEVANWNMDDALDALFAFKESQFSSAPRVSPPAAPVAAPVAAPAPVAAAPLVASDATPLLLQLQAEKQHQLQQEQQEHQRKQERLLKLLQQERMDEPPPPPVAKSPPPVAKSVTPPKSASPKSASPKLSARSSTSASSAASLAAANDESHALALVIMSSVRELQGMGFEGEAAERALHANGGDLGLALNSLLKQSS